MMKKLMSLALAFTFVFVGANAAFAAPDTPVDHAAFTSSTDCAACHSPAITEDANIHAISAHSTCANCHTDSAPMVDESPVDCSPCHNGATKASFEKTRLEDNTTPEIESDDEVAGDGLGHHLNEDGTQDDCGTCHVNRTYEDTDGDTIKDITDTDVDGDGLANGAYNEVTLVYAAGDDANATYVDVFLTSADGVYAGNVNTDAFELYAGATISAAPDYVANTSAKVQVQPEKGTVSFNTTTGAWTYTPDPVTFDGTDTFVLRGYDAAGHRYFMEITVTGEALNTDEDSDGLTLGQERGLGTNPTLADSDNDGIKDGVEVAEGLDPVDPADAALDADNDGLTNLEEVTAGTDLNNADTDGDGTVDGEDSDPLNGPVAPPTPGTGGNGGGTTTTPSENNPNTGGTAGLLVPVVATAVAGAGLVVTRKKN